ncbi:MAG TPA: ATP-binding protein [Anaerolineae bacterium]|nr:ATP-binding protein [Anaerolineae bacterium]HOQ97333.1 ATP-binding protein [Anaerolineae bacterium]HOQ97336.1 ATP-binding protein [Anaerolineae bacterium]HPL27767.1 ATP-binding protein [Anaerolineae bacterium]HPL27770.1 ATP-binding protein [Anaerolineae bacterium]
MKAEQGRALLAAGPGERFAVLPAHGALARLAQTLAALANASGGTVLVALHAARGAADEAAFDEAVQAGLSCEPPLVLPLPQPLEIDGRAYLALAVPPGLPHVYACGGAYYRRQGKENVALGPRPLRELFLARANPGQESLAAPGATGDDIDWQAVRAYAEQLAPRPGGTLEELLRRRGGLDAELAPTYAGILLFGRNPQQFLPAAEILCVRYPGTTMGDVFMQETVRGALPEQIRRAEAFLASNMRRGARIEALERDERPEYPLPVVRESIVNAVAHRDYGIRGEEIRVLLFADRLEVYSPGRLPGHVTLENMLHERYARNEIIMQVLADMGFVERLGYGIDRMLQLMQAEGLPAPAFVETANGLRVTLCGHGERLIEARPDGFRWSALALNLRQEKALAYVAEHGRITNREFQELCPDVSAETVRRDLADLVDQDVLIRIGDKRATFYILKK